MSSTPETRYAKTADGVHIAYETLGDGPVDVLLLGPYFSNLEHMRTHPTWERMSLPLAEVGRLMRLDGRGTGLSDRVAGERLPTLEERIDDLRAVLDAVESERTVIVCFADSGPLGCLFAATYPASQRLG